MLKIYIKTAWRSLVSNRIFSALNVFGLAAGMAVALLIGLWINLPIAAGLKNEIPGIIWAAPCFEGGNALLTVGEKNLYLRAYPPDRIS